MANVINARANNQIERRFRLQCARMETDLIDLTHMTDRPLISLTDRESNGWISQILVLLLIKGFRITGHYVFFLA